LSVRRSRSTRPPSLAALGVPAFRLFLAQDLLGRIGLWGFELALAWIVLEQTGSGVAVALVQTAIVLPMPLSMLLAGSLTDRFGPRRPMTAGWAVSTGVVLVTLVLLAAGSAGVPVILGLMVLLGLGFGLYVVPAQICVGRSVPPPLVADALGLTWLGFGTAQVIGAPLGGTVLQVAGSTVALGVSAAACAAAALVSLALPDLPGPDTKAGNLWGDAVASASVLRRSRRIRGVVLLGCATAAFVSSNVAVAPLVARNLLTGDASAMGIMLACGGAGAITSALCVGRLGRRIGRGRLLVGSLGLGGLAVAGLGISHVTAVSAALAAVVSASTVAFTATAVLVIQAATPVRLRGRTVALYNAPFYTILPAVEAAAGSLSDTAGVGSVLTGFGLTALGVAGGAAVLAAGRIRSGVSGVRSA
jgi:MFS family permease